VVLDDERAITVFDENPHEERLVTFGLDALTRVLAAAYRIKDETVRIISARKATRRERAQYEDKRL
jgi:uncharacterized protein